MVLRDVERFKVVVVELDLRAFRDREAEADEDLLELVEHDIEPVSYTHLVTPWKVS